ncbi:methyltransferase [Inquilinus sp. CA228]|uniref:methyltransferase n=1 Tax=Inquilinus sp. CA228 TaxID=3455609 RepID=UPI003F8D4B1B
MNAPGGSDAPAQALRRLIAGYQTTFLVQVAAELDLADRLAAGPRRADELAAATDTQPGPLRRVLSALVQLGLLTRDRDGRFGLTALGEGLRSDHPAGLNAFARYQAHAIIQRPWSGLLHTIRTGETAFEAVFGRSLFDHLADHPADAALFTAGMAARTAEPVAAIVAGYDWRRFGTIVDLGGADGALLTAILAAAPQSQGVVFDLPRVRDAAERRIAEAGLQDRCYFADGDFFATAPADGDAFILKYVLHDWGDDEVVAILGTIRQAAPWARILVIEPLLPEDGELAPEVAMMDIAMLAITGGRERSAAEFAALYDRAGFRLHRVVATASPFRLLEGRPIRPRR